MTDFLLREPWAVLDSSVPFITDVLGGRISETQIRAQLARRERARSESRGFVAVLPLIGILTPRSSIFEFFGFGTSLETVKRQFHAALADKDVKSILLDIDSPGGSVFGVEELWTEIFKHRGQKAIVAHANHTAASAAYFIATAADEIVASPSGQVGSIGVVGVHVEGSKRDKEQGFGITVIKAGKHKAEGNPFEPLDKEAREHIQNMIDQHYRTFVRAVAKGRGVSASDVRNGFGEGRVVSSKDALKLGMVDRLGTFDESIAALSSGGGVRSLRSGKGFSDLDRIRGRLQARKRKWYWIEKGQRHHE